MLIAEALTDFNHLEDSLAPSSIYSSADKVLLENLINYCSRFILNYTNRKTFKYHTVSDEYHDGDGGTVILLKEIPTISITSIYLDINREFNADDLITTSYYYLENSDTGLIRLINKTTPNGRKVIKVSYVAGYSEFKVHSGFNDQLTLAEGQTNYTTTLSSGTYNASTLASALQDALNNAGTLTYTVSFSEATQRLTITATGNFALSFSGTRQTACASLLGFDPSNTQTQGTTQYSDYPLLGIPQDIIGATNAFVLWRYEEVKERRSGKFSESRGEQSYSYDYSNLPTYIREVLDLYHVVG